MPSGFCISLEAIRDLEDIWSYTKMKWSEQQADRYYQLIVREINFISSKPLWGISYEHVRPGYRAAKMKSHLIFYKVVQDQVHVVRILHERMNLEDHLAMD
jgi:toxin ParE1/3/4